MQSEIHKKKRRASSFSKKFAKTRRPARPLKGERVLREVSAGGIVFRRTPRGVQFAVMRDSYDKWAFPKGHVESGEQFPEAAARETLEELGISEILLVDYLGQIDIWFRDRFEKRGALIHKDIHYYLFETPSDTLLKPDPKEHAFGARWVPMKRLILASSYPDMVPILRRALQCVHTLLQENR